MKRRYPYSYGRRVRRRVRRPRRALKRRTVLSKAYHCQYNKRRNGRVLRRSTRNDRIVAAATNKFRLLHQRMTDWSGAGAPFGTVLRGARFLGYSGNRDLNVNLITYPGVIFSLHCIRQGTGSTSTPAFGIVKDNTGAYKYWQEYGYSIDGVTPVQEWQFEDTSRTSGAGTETRRNGFCNWTRLRLQFYGKTKSPTMIRVRLIKFIDEQSTPDAQTYTSGYSAALPSQMRAQLDQNFKPLINNTIAGQINPDRPAFRTIKTWAINIDPTETDQNDTDVYRRVVDIFNRWNKVVSFRSANTSAVTDIDMNNAMTEPSLQNAYGAYPNPYNSGYHVFVDSFQPIKKDQVAAGDPFDACTVAETASMDWKLQSSWSEINN